MFCYRLVKKKYADTAFSGEGARRKNSRWMPKGSAVVYASESKALAALELFVNLGDEGREIRLVCIQAEIPDTLKISEIKLSVLPENWRETPAPEALMSFGAEWYRKSETAVLRVPSVVITTEFNYLINLSHPDFKKIKINPPEDVCYDPRMWKQHKM